MNSDDAEAFKQALAKLMAIVDRLDARNMQTTQRIEAAAARLEQGGQRLEGGGERFAKTALGVIGSETKQTIMHGAGQAFGGLQQQLQHSVDSANGAVQGMDKQRKKLSGIVWLGLSALSIGALLATGAAAYSIRQSRQLMEQAQFGQDILQATQRGAITRCGAALCVKIGKKPQRYGDYTLLPE